MTTILIILLLVAVLGLFSWKWFGAQTPVASESDTYSCPICNEQHCECNKDRGP